MREIVDAPVSTDHGIVLPVILQVLAGVDAVNQQVEIDSLRRFGALGRIGRVGPLRRVGVGRIVTEDAHLHVVAIAPVQGQVEMALVAGGDLGDRAPGLDRRTVHGEVGDPVVAAVLNIHFGDGSR